MIYFRVSQSLVPRPRCCCSSCCSPLLCLSGSEVARSPVVVGGGIDRSTSLARLF
jgi:hypothetical protein